MPRKQLEINALLRTYRLVGFGLGAAKMEVPRIAKKSPKKLLQYRKGLLVWLCSLDTDSETEQQR
jgi:hypothetical protein